MPIPVARQNPKLSVPSKTPSSMPITAPSLIRGGGEDKPNSMQSNETRSMSSGVLSLLRQSICSYCKIRIAKRLIARHSRHPIGSDCNERLSQLCRRLISSQHSICTVGKLRIASNGLPLVARATQFIVLTASTLQTLQTAHSLAPLH